MINPDTPRPMVAYRKQLSEQMLDGPLQPAERDQLASSLSRYDTGVLEFARQAGLRIQVARVGENLFSKDVFRAHSLEEFRQQAPRLAEVAAAYHQEFAESRAGLDTPEARKAYRVRLHNWLTDAGLDLAVYSPNSMRVLRPELPPDSLLSEEAVALEGMAIAHGCDSPQEKKAFFELAESINGPRLEDARQQTIEATRSRLAERPEFLQQVLAQWQERPELIPVDSLKHTILMPGLYFAGPPEDRKLLDNYDFEALGLWQGREGHIVDRWVEPSADVDYELNGEYLLSKNILVRDRCLDPSDKTAVHEFAHAVDWILEEKAPDWYKGWKTRLLRAFHAMRGEPQRAITPYARANPREYVAEGIAHYYYEPEKLKATDPACFELMHEMVQVAAMLGGVDPEIEGSHLEVLSETQTQILKVMAEPDAPALEQAAKTLHSRGLEAMARSGREAALEVLKLGSLAGAVDAVLGKVLEQQSPTDLSYEACSAASRGKLEQGYQQAYLAGAALVTAIKANGSPRDSA
ncbi:MAG: zinc-dependent peptidase [Candidatus Eremiobacteraeota bacterium]|nr:zinc-dependent peptidase [Candidatus Eremiobacteraeota bacterium]